MFDDPSVARTGPDYAIERDVHGSYIARDGAGTLCLLVPTTGARPPLDRATGDVHLTFRLEGDFTVGGEDFKSPAAIIRCENVALSETFAVLAHDIASALRASRERPAPHDVSRALARWEELLRSRKQLSRDEETGLWGELWTLLELHDFDRGLAAWRGPDAEQVDFVGGGVGVECKAGMRRLEHWISQEQLRRPLGDLEVYLLSLWVAIDAVGGATLPEMIARAEAAASDLAVLEKKLLAAGYSRTDSHRYRLRLRVLENPMLFPISVVPRVRSADAGVSRIRFLASLDADAALEHEAVMPVLARLCS